jgi:heterodisulfide reductase subunit C
MLRSKIVPDTKSAALKQIFAMSGQKINDCIQCAKCSANCPTSSYMDILPHQVVRLLQLGQVDKIAASKSIWNCAACFTCVSRCPRNIDIAKLMEAVRLTLLRCCGQSRFTADNAPGVIDEAMPQQAIVSGFRKYNK